MYDIFGKVVRNKEFYIFMFLAGQYKLLVNSEVTEK